MKILSIGKVRDRLSYIFDKMGDDITCLDELDQITISIPFDDKIWYKGKIIRPSEYDAILMLRISSICKSLYALLIANGYNVIGNPFDRIRLDNKLTCIIALYEAGIPTVTTMYSHGTVKKEEMSELGQDIIVKPINLSEGIDVKLCNINSLPQGVKGQLYQEYINCDATDERWLIVNGEIVCAMERKSLNPTEFRSNLSQGGVGKKIEITDDMRVFARKTYDLFPGAIYCGMDVFRLPTPDGYRFLANELNYIPGDKIIGVTNHNYYQDIYDYIVSIVK